MNECCWLAVCAPTLACVRTQHTSPHPRPRSAAAPRAAAPARKKVLGFGEEEEEEKPQRRLIPIRYSEEEVQALQQQAAGGAEQDAAAAAQQQLPAAAAQQPQQQQPAQDAAALKRQLMASIPKDTAGVFAFPIKWAQLDRAPQDVRDRIAGGLGSPGAAGCGWAGCSDTCRTELA